MKTSEEALEAMDAWSWSMLHELGLSYPVYTPPPPKPWGNHRRDCPCRPCVSYRRKNSIE